MLVDVTVPWKVVNERYFLHMGATYQSGSPNAASASLLPSALFFASVPKLADHIDQAMPRNRQ